MFGFPEGDVPAWYEIVPSVDGFLLRLHPGTWKRLLEMNWADAPIVPEVVQAFGFKKFSPPKNRGPLGFEEALQRSPVGPDGWIAFEAVLPRVLVSKDPFKANWHRAFALSATLSLLFMLLDEPVVTDADRPQDFTAILSAEKRDCYGFSLGFILSPSMSVRILELKSGPSMSAVELAMARASARMWPWQKGDRHAFRAWLGEQRGIHLEVPGNACGLDTDFMWSSDESGIRLAPHNTDSPLQQLSLFCGVIELVRLAKEPLGVERTA